MCSNVQSCMYKSRLFSLQFYSSFLLPLFARPPRFAQILNTPRSLERVATYHTTMYRLTLMMFI
jgi:hypothetical protein